ncbi:MAG: SUMF1/EgtB/PvdO family nonheme iron enzyme [Deltaproteobacteria bacterium]|nr:MAG: SUMF1/EgtB/PvdO family nonheme iron enzyme [Deltaproteobacteria bacterium]
MPSCVGRNLYRHGRFHLRDTQYAAHPVVRVTWYGAFAYAHHYGKRLPTEYEKVTSSGKTQPPHFPDSSKRDENKNRPKEGSSKHL